MRPPGVLDLAPGIAASYAPISLLILVVIGAALLASRSRRMPPADAARATLLDLGLAVWLALTLLVTVVPMGRSGRPPIGFIPFLDALDRIAQGMDSPADEAADIVSNVILFLPLGAWFALRLGRSWRAAAIVAGAVLSLGIETSQALEGAGRFASATDVVTNTTGTALGFVLAIQARRSPDTRPGPDRTGEDPPA